MTHFENFWEDAEQLSRQMPEATISTSINNIRAELDNLLLDTTISNKQAEIVGKIIFQLCIITDRTGINSAAALKLATENAKAQLLDPEDSM